MIELEAPIYHWTATGMRQMFASGHPASGYIQVRDAEQLLEDAHKRGYEAGLNAKKDDER